MTGHRPFSELTKASRWHAGRVWRQRPLHYAKR